MPAKSIIEGSAKVCTFKYGEPIKVKVKISTPKFANWYEKEKNNAN